MRRIAIWALAGCISTFALANEPSATPELTAAQIVDKNVAARGGLEAWQKIQTMMWIGHIQNADPSASTLPFALELKRPDKTRFEIQVQSQLFTRIFDGSRGWKMQPGRAGQPEVKDYSAEELKYARDGGGLDGPLMDYRAKGVIVALEGIDEINGHKAYRLSATLPSGARQRMWIDTQSFLDIKHDRETRNRFGQQVTLSVFYSDYRAIDGLHIPMTIERKGADNAQDGDKMVIDKVLLNPPLEERLFSKPNIPASRQGVPVAPPRSTEPRRAGSPPSISGGLPGFTSLPLAGSGGIR